MLLGDLVGFKEDLFFNGAVQLRWVEEQAGMATEAAKHFVFHGPQYHGVSQDEAEGLSSTYRLKDTATLLVDFLESLASGGSSTANPFSLIVAGYGSGKSHFALTLAQLLMAPNDPLAWKIIHNVRIADEEIGERVEALLDGSRKPSLVVTLDGMSNFHLGNEMSRGVLRQLRARELDLGPILELSPRFGYAQDFVIRNFEIRKGEFQKELAGRDRDAICAALMENDEDVYQSVDDVYFRANGTRIPVEGRESAQDLITAVCQSYCGDDGPFANMVILFDEFGRYLEYAADKPWLAGDSALQQVFQGVQDNANQAKFVGFIQYELKAYLSRFGQKDRSQLQRYITRFDSAQKFFLSTNLETLFAHLIEKRDASVLNTLMELDENRRAAVEAHSLLSRNLPGIAQLPVWSDIKKFQQVIVKGCWPLNPLTTWFLTRQQDIVQSRSALTFIKDILDTAAGKNIEPDGTHLYTVSPAELVLRSMLDEITAAERVKGGVVAETLCTLLEKYGASLREAHRLVLAGIMVLDKLRVERRERGEVDRLLLLTTGLRPQSLDEVMSYLSKEVGVVEWNGDLGRYELVVDAATRGQFQQALRKKLLAPSAASVGELFTNNACSLGDLKDVETDFAEARSVYSRDWCFLALFAHGGSYLDMLSRAFDEWRGAENHDDAKGRIVYLYLGPDEDPEGRLASGREFLDRSLSKAGTQAAPVWTVVIHDREGGIAENLARFQVIEQGFSSDEVEKYRRFLPEERGRCLGALKEEVQKAVQLRIFSVAGLDDIAPARLGQTGRQIFERVYPNVLPFPFDGFQTKGGTGPKECLQLTRALIGRQVSGDWIATQAAPIQRRVNQVFVKSWKVLGNDGRIAPKPGLKELTSLLDKVEVALQRPDGTLYEAYRMLLDPPYGFSSSSAGLALGLVLARETPSRVLTCRGEHVGVQEWLQIAFPKQGKFAFDKGCLTATRVVFISEDSLDRWRKVIFDLEYEENLRRKVELFQAAKKMQRQEQIPETLKDRFNHLADKVEQAQVTLAEYVQKVQTLERSLESALRRMEIAKIIRCGSDLKRLLTGMEEQPALWGVEEFEEVKRLIADALGALDGRIIGWLEQETCNGYGKLDSFKFIMDKSVQGLVFLGLKEEADLVENHKHQIVGQLESRIKFETSITSAQDLLRQSSLTKNSAAWKLNDELRTCEASIENLKMAYATLGSMDIAKLIDQVRARRTQVKSSLEEQKQELAAIYNMRPSRPQDVRALQGKVSGLVTLFKGTADERNLVDMSRQLDILFNDMQAWSAVILPPEETERVLRERITARCTELEESLEEEDWVWTFAEVYDDFREFVVKERVEQSARWFGTAMPDLTTLETWSIRECTTQLSAISAPPGFVSAPHAEKIEEAAAKIRERVEALKERERSKSALAWIEEMRGQVEQAETAVCIEACETLLRSLERLPEFVSEKEMPYILAMRNILIGRLDSLDVQSILERIRNLRDDLRKELLAALAALYLS